MSVNVQEPPAIYATVPLPPGVDLRLPLAQVNRVCHALGLSDPLATYAGCSVWGDGGCLTVSERGNDAALRHEHAHCNGWPADHPK